MKLIKHPSETKKIIKSIYIDESLVDMIEKDIINDGEYRNLSHVYESLLNMGVKEWNKKQRK